MDVVMGFVHHERVNDTVVVHFHRKQREQDDYPRGARAVPVS
jgi:hypothetical protein